MPAMKHLICYRSYEWRASLDGSSLIGLPTTVLYTSQNSARAPMEAKCDVPRSRNKVAIP